MTQLSQEVRDHVYSLLFDQMNLCCGLPETSFELIRELMTCFREKRDIGALLPDDGARYLVLSVLDHADLIEHGSIIDASWLTKKGEWHWQALTRCEYDDIEGQAGLPHDGEPCTDACLKPFWILR